MDDLSSGEMKEHLYYFWLFSSLHGVSQSTMNYFLIFVIIALLGGGYYEYTLQQQKDTFQQQKATLQQQTDIEYQQQIKDLKGKLTKLESDKADLETQKNDLSKNLAEAQTKISDLNARLTAPPPKPTPPPPPPPSFNDLGTVVIPDGKTYRNCWLLRVETDGITFNHSLGITKVLFPILPPALQKKFGYDLHTGPNLPLETVQSLETQRKNALKTSNH